MENLIAYLYFFDALGRKKEHYDLRASTSEDYKKQKEKYEKFLINKGTEFSFLGYGEVKGFESPGDFLKSIKKICGGKTYHSSTGDKPINRIRFTEKRDIDKLERLVVEHDFKEFD
jgi:hypothetical protein